MNLLSLAFNWFKEKAVSLNEEGIPLPLIRDQHMNGGSLPGTMFFISFNIAMLTLIGKVTERLGNIDYSNVLWLLGVTGSFWVIEALGKKISIGKDKIEVDSDAENKE